MYSTKNIESSLLLYLVSKTSAITHYVNQTFFWGRACFQTPRLRLIRTLSTRKPNEQVQLPHL